MNSISTEVPTIPREGLSTEQGRSTADSEPMASPAPSAPDPWKVRLGAKALFPGEEAGPRGDIAKGLAALDIPDLRVISSPGALALYSRDEADVPDMLRKTLFDSMPDAVAQPFSTAAVAAVLKYASSKDCPVVVRGAGSWPFGGSMPVKGGIVLDMNTMDGILGLDPSAGIVKVQAGVRWADLDWYLEKWGLGIRSSPSSRFSTVGGWIATGGIGIGSVSSGHLSLSVREMEVALPSGEVRTVRPGDPSFKPMFGSEGRLAVIVSATLETRRRASSPAPRLFLFPDHEPALRFASSLAEGERRPMDLTYYSPSKFDGFNQVLGKACFPVAHGVMATYESEKDPGLAGLRAPENAKAALPYLAHLMWNERFFPMKARRLGPGLMGAEVVAPRARLSAIVGKAQKVAEAHGLRPMIEIHFMQGGDGMLLCYYLTDQTRQLKYTMDSFRGLLITSALLEAGAQPYSYGVWNNAFSDRSPREEGSSLKAAKRDLDPRDLMNRGKFPRLKGRFGGLPAALFSPAALGSALKLVNLVEPASAQALKLIEEGRAFDREKGDLLLETADECAMCGACVGVCPAYQMTRDERVTGRGKLLMARMLEQGAEVTKEDARRAFLCMRCKACEQVCQSKLELVPAYEELERRLEAAHGRDDEEIRRFVQMAEKSPAYDALVERGLVLGSATRELNGGR